MLPVLLILGACDDEFPVPEASTVAAKFSVQSNETVISFVNETRVSDDAGSVSYIWNFGDGTSSNETNPTHEYSEVGIYTVQLVAVAQNDLDTYTQEVVVLGALDVRLFYINGNQQEISELRGDISFTLDGVGYGIDYDAVSGKIYYTDDSNGTLMRANLDGSDIEEVADGFSSPRDVALNPAGNKAYVVDRGADAVYVIDLLNGTSEVLYDTSNGLGELPVAIDFFEDNLYITCVEIDFETVWKAKADGSGVENIIGYGAGGYGYGLAIDKVNRHIYFDNQEDGVIMRADLDGANVVPVVEKVGRVYGIAVDGANGQLYFSDRGDGLIKKSDLNGDNLVAVSLELEDPQGIFIIE
jgi:hypothetical protein